MNMAQLRRIYGGNPFTPTFGIDGWMAALVVTIVICASTFFVDGVVFAVTGADLSVDHTAEALCGFSSVCYMFRSLSYQAAHDDCRASRAGIMLIIIAVLGYSFIVIDQIALLLKWWH